MWQHIFGESTRESTTSIMSSMKGENSSTNGSDLDKNNIVKPTFDTLTKEGRKAFDAYRADFEELFLSRCEVTRQGTILKDTMPIIFHKAEVIPKVWPDPSPSRNDVQSMINSVLERQIKNTDELLRRSIEERDGKKLDATSINPPSSSCVVNFTQTNPQTSGTSAGGTTMPSISTQLRNHFHSRTTIESSAPTFGMLQQTTTSIFEQGYMQTTPSFSMPNLTSAPYTPEGNGQTYAYASGNYQDTYSIIAHIDYIPLPGSSLDFLPSHAYQNVPRFNGYGHLEACHFGYEISP
jgi:hypothetical protein